MIEHYFVDTTFLVARFDPEDKFHERAMGLVERFAEEEANPPRFILTDYVFDETVTAILVRTRGHRAAVIAGNVIRGSRTTAIVVVDRSLVDRAWDLFSRRTDKEWSFTDCVSFVTMKDYRLSRALSFDRNFREAGFETLP